MSPNPGNGILIVDAGGNLVINEALNIGDAANASGVVTVNTGGTLTVNGNTTTIDSAVAPDFGTLNVNGGVFNEANDLIIGDANTGIVNVTNNGMATVGDDVIFGLSGGAGTLNINTGGVFEFRDDMFTVGGAGTINLDGGTLVSNHTAVFGNPDGKIHSGVNIVLLGTGGTIEVANSPAQIDGNISGAGIPLTKTGPNTLEFNGNKTYTGVTTINEGTLYIRGGSGDGIIRNDVIINNGGAFQLGTGNRVVNSAIITVNPGGIFNAGGQPEAFAYLAGGGDVINHTSTFELDLGPEGPQEFSGTLTGGGNLRLRGNNGTGEQILSGTTTFGNIELRHGSNSTRTNTLTLSGAGTTNASNIQMGLVNTNGTAVLNILDTHTLNLSGSITDSNSGTTIINLERNNPATLNSTNITVDNFNINPLDAGGDVNYTRTGGTLTVNDSLQLGGDSGNNGNLTQNGGTITTTNLVYGGAAAGNDRGGTFRFNGGTFNATTVIEGAVGSPNNSINTAQFYVDADTISGPDSVNITGDITVQSFRVGDNNDGTFNFNTGQTITNTGTFFVGRAAEGLFVQDGGIVTTSPSGNDVRLGDTASGNGTYRLNSGTLTVDDNLQIGISGTGLMDVIDGTLNVGTAIRIGDGGSGTGTLNIGRPAMDTSPQVNVNSNLENGDNGTGIVNMYSGTVTMTANNNWIIGQTSSGMATFNMFGGMVDFVSNTTGNGILKANSGDGIVNMTGGTLHFQDIEGANNAAGSTVYNFDGGNVIIDDNLDYRNNGTDTVNLRGATLDLTGGTIHFGNRTGTNAFNFTGGTLQDVTTFNGDLTQNNTDAASLLEIGAPGAIDTMTVSGSYNQIGGTLAIDIGSNAGPGTGHDQLIVNGATATFGGVIDVDLVGGFNPADQNSFDLVGGTAAIAGPGSLNFAGPPSWDFSDAILGPGLAWNTQDFLNTGTIGIGSEGSIWDANNVAAGSGNTGGLWSDQSWTNNAAGTGFTGFYDDNTIAIFSAGNDGVGPFTVGVDSAVNVMGINFEEGSGTVTLGDSGGSLNLTGAMIDVASGVTGRIDSQLLGNSGINKTGDGTLIINRTAGPANGYTGALTVDGGTVIASGFGGDAVIRGDINVNNGAQFRLDSNNIIVNTSDITVNGTGVFNMNGRTDAVGNLNGDGNIINNTNGGGILLDDITGTHTFSGDISGNGGLQVRGNAGSTGEQIFDGGTANLGTFRQARGTVTLTNSPDWNLTGGLIVADNRIGGVNGGTNATFNIDSGTLTARFIQMGDRDTNTVTGTINQIGGDVNTTGVSADNAGVRLGHWPNTNVTYNLMGGTLTVGDNRDLTAAINGTGTFHQTGGIANAERIVPNGRNASGNGTINIEGGRFNVGAGGINNVGGGTYSVMVGGQGGTLAASATWSSPLDMTLFGAGINAATFDTNGNNINLNGLLSGAGGLNKEGAGNLTLTQRNTYAGDTIVNGGVLTLNAPNAATSTIGTGTLIVNGATVNSNVNGFGWTFVNPIEIYGGSVNQLVADSHLNTVLMEAGTLGGPGEFRLHRDVTTLASATSSVINVGTLGIWEPLNFNVADGAAAIDLQVSSVITQNNAFTKLGDGVMAINSVGSTFGGDINVLGGTLLFNGGANTDPVGTNSARTITVGPGATLTALAGTHNPFGTGGQPPLVVINGGTMNTANYQHMQNIHLTGGLIQPTSAGTQVDGVDFRNGPTVTSFASGTTSEIASKMTLRNQGANGGVTFDVANGTAATDLLLSGQMVSSGVVIKNGAGLLEITNNSNSYTGTTTVNDGVLKVSADNALGASGAGQGTTVNSPGAVELASGVNTAEPLFLNGAGSGLGALFLNDGGSATASGPIVIASDATIGAFDGSTLNLNGPIDKNGTTVTFLGNGAATNFININGGVTGAALGSDLIVDNVTTNINSVMDYNGPTFVRNGGVIEMQAGGGIITTGMTVGDTGAGTVNHDTGEISIDGPTGVGNSGNLIVGPASPGTSGIYNLSGDGRLTFNDTAAGTQVIANPATDPSTLTVGPNGTFNFIAGTLDNVTTINMTNAPSPTLNQQGGDFIIGVDGGLAIDGSAVRAITTIEDANYTLGANATLHLDIFGPSSHGGSGEAGGVLTIDPLDPLLDSDLLYVSGDPLQGLGNALLAGTLDINLNGYEPAPFHWYDVLLADGDITIDENTFMVDGVNFYRVIDNPNGPGQLLQVAVPEPASIALWAIIAGVLLLAGRRWNSRR